MQSLLFLMSFAALVTARTDLSGCTSSETVVYGGASYVFWVPGTGEICSFLDCGGGRAPPATTVPGCPQYVGTATYSPSYLPGYHDGSIAASTTSVAGSSTSQSSAMITGSQTTFAISQQTSSSSVISSSDMSSSSASSAVFTTSPTGITSGSPSVSSSSTQSPSKSTTSSSSAVAPSVTGNAGATTTNNYLSHGLVGAVAAGFAFLL
ncbi:hypothetical protein EG329_001322 [Mollisiaceae sp. DMI_Dod_QoI]|nr:hypothetical protein EG329_001322 [Helotiales sp. DMI_Dod_QoI]